MGFGTKTHWQLGVGVAAGLTVGLAIGRRGRMQRMPRLDAWQRALAEQWGEVRAAMLASCVLTKYQALYVRRPRFARRVLQSHLERNILPGLALYQVLLEETGTQRDALVEIEHLFEVAPAKNRSMPPLPGDSSELIVSAWTCSRPMARRNSSWLFAAEKINRGTSLARMTCRWRARVWIAPSWSPCCQRSRTKIAPWPSCGACSSRDCGLPQDKRPNLA